MRVTIERLELWPAQTIATCITSHLLTAISYKNNQQLRSLYRSGHTDCKHKAELVLVKKLRNHTVNNFASVPSPI